MCYSAQVWANYRKYVREFGATISVEEFAILYFHDKGKTRPKTPKAMDDAFAAGETTEERDIWRQIQLWNAEAASKAEQELFTQTTRLNTAQRALQTKVTKKAQEDVRIATNKIEAAKQKLADLRRTDDALPRDSRVFPGVYAPVMIWEDGRRVIKPMRYFCRLPGWTEAVERKFPGTYNARRDKLESSWKDLFGYQHGIMVADVFYENVEGPNGENQVLAFTPKTAEPMLIACLWNRSPGYKGAPDLYSFAAITDEPEPEVAAAGHDRTIINIKPEHIDAWLRPDAGNLAALYAIFDDKRHPYYEHRLAA
ncbi:SOS response-associated peptidase family protein [Lysobacter auxotrophicus]|uniref:Abasic site processing protein n=1 Tax=Lysobacter auxotrophicus TaxID=2992573 RepID=A0ABN6UMD5_9GAMM|nr:SOS response-associated peptidase family protein [Lysobacter auxotrophicus]BDU17510.1 SOS response-associated peptidase family protein [Lysobacter auxotrophicus]